MSEVKPRLAWARANGSVRTQEATADCIRLFTSTWDSSKAHPGEPWVMRSDLPGLVGHTWRSESEAELQGRAERILAAWLARVTGGQWS